ncbi:MAG: winged helix-turn-helix domain-containing protein [Bacteroidales bacterium]|nr:winged helix-turn-helix domain-containing protein [Bacteroidales bacterium]
MIINNAEIGVNACFILETLEESEPVSFTELEKLTGLGEKPILMALGWLARESKIFQINPFKENWEIYKINY